MMQLIHKAYACETKSMEQLTLALRSTTILVPRAVEVCAKHAKDQQSAEPTRAQMISFLASLDYSLQTTERKKQCFLNTSLTRSPSRPTLSKN